MIDAVAVVEMRAAAGAIADPAEVVGRDRVPAVDRHAPVLSGVAERIGRNADRGVEHEERLIGPDVGAVAVDHERQIAEQTDAVGVCGGASLLPLRVRQPLQVLVKQDVVGQLEPRLRQRVAVGDRAPARPTRSTPARPHGRESPGTARSRPATTPDRRRRPRAPERGRCRDTTRDRETVRTPR